jgi:hypothetical protein
MRKCLICIVLIFVVGLFAGPAATAVAQVNNIKEPGSLLVVPLVDNINYQTIIEITNRSNADVWLQGYAILHAPGTPGVFEKKDFYIHITQKEPFWWQTFLPYSRVDASGQLTQIQGFPNLKGFMFFWAIDSEKTQLEIQHNHLKGDVLIYGAGRAFGYNMIPHQGLAVVGDRILNLDGVEYTMATSQVMCEGFAEGFSGIGGTWAVCNLDIDFINSVQPEFDINIEAWNQNEFPGTRHLHFFQFQQYDLTNDLQLHINQVFTPKFQFATSCTDALWSVFLQWTGNLGWANLCWQHPGHGVPAVVILPTVPSMQ